MLETVEKWFALEIEHLKRFTRTSMLHEYLIIEQSPALRGQAELEGAKNAVLVIMASLILTSGKSRLTNVPASSDVYTMIALLKELGAQVDFDVEQKMLYVDTSSLEGWQVSPEIIKKIRASILVMGPLFGPSWQGSGCYARW